MKIRLFSDYRGVLTNEVFYLAGEHVLPDGVAQALIKASRAVAVEPEVEEPTPKPKTTRTKRTRKPKAK